MMWPVYLLQEGVYAGELRTFQDLCVRDLILPTNMEETTEAAEVEVVQLLGMPAVSSPCLTAIQ